MSYEHFSRAGHCGLRAAARVGLAAGLILAAAGAHAFTSQVTGVSGFTPSPGGLPGGLLTGGGFLNSAASRTAITNAAGRIITIPLQLTAGPTAGRVIAGACFANPALCVAGAGAVALGAWFLASKIQWTGTQYEVSTNRTGIVYYVIYNGQRLEADSKAGVADIVAGRVCAANNCVRKVWYVYDTPANHLLWDDPNQGGDFAITYWKLDATQSEVAYSGGVWSTNAVEGEVSGPPRPANETDFQTHADTYPVHVGLNPDNQIGWSPDAVLNASPVAVPVESPVFEEVSEPLSEPYPGTDPKVGPWYQDWLDVTGLPNTDNPLDVEVKPVTKPADNPNTPEDESPTTGGGDNPEEKPMEDPCKLHPDSVMCTDLGTAPTDPVPKSTVNVSWAAESLGLPAGCPSPLSAAGHSISYQSACDAMVTIRPIVILVAGLMALLIAVAAVRGVS